MFHPESLKKPPFGGHIIYLFITIPTDKIQKTSKMSDAAQQHYWCPGPPLGEGED